MPAKSLKTLFIIFFIFVLLLSARLVIPKYQTEKSGYLEKTSSITKDSVGRLEISKGNDKVELIRDGDIWKVSGKKADKAIIDAILSFFLPISPPEIIAQTDKRHDELSLSDEKATKIKLGEKLTVLSGKTSGSEMYVRFEGSPDVYLLSFPPPIPLSSADWLDLTVVEIDRTKLTKLSFKDISGTLILIKKEDTWIRESDTKETNSEKMNTILFTLSKLSASSLYDEKSKTWYPQKSALTLTVDYDGKSETLDFFKGESDFLVKRSSDGERFIISESSISALLSASKELF